MQNSKYWGTLELHSVRMGGAANPNIHAPPRHCVTVYQVKFGTSGCTHMEINVKKNCSLSTTYNAKWHIENSKNNERWHYFKVVLCHCQRASKVISPFIVFAVFDVSFRRYKLWHFNDLHRPLTLFQLTAFLKTNTSNIVRLTDKVTILQ